MSYKMIYDPFETINMKKMMMKNYHFRCVLWLLGCEADHIMVSVYFLHYLVINQWIIKYLIANIIVIHFHNAI